MISQALADIAPGEGDLRRAAVTGDRKVATRTISEIAESTRHVAAHRRDYLTPAKERK